MNVGEWIAVGLGFATLLLSLLGIAYQLGRLAQRLDNVDARLTEEMARNQPFRHDKWDEVNEAIAEHALAVEKRIGEVDGRLSVIEEQLRALTTRHPKGTL